MRYERAPSKVLVLDCDNTIWGGVIGEDGISGIVLGQDGLGQAFVDFQLAAKNLAEEGVILALASKNNENDVWDVIEKHTSMILKRKDIISYKINWNEKSDNLQQISQELDLSLNSFVFWDDNPIEREKVRNILPEVNTVEVSKNVFDWPRQLANLDCFAKFDLTEDDKRKTEQYRSRACFKRDRVNVVDEASYLKSIKLRPQALRIGSSNIIRASQLCAKTNQFNLRTIRHSVNDINVLISSNKDLCFLVSLEDLYGDHGIVGLTCLSEINSSIVFLDTLLMSCRVIGRHLEAWMLNEALKRANICGYKYLIGEFLETKKNVICKDFLISHGFKPLSQTDHSNSLIWKNFTKTENLYLCPTTETAVPFVDVYEHDKI